MAQAVPEVTVTTPLAGVVACCVHDAGTVSVTVCVPGRTLSKRPMPAALFVAVRTESRGKVNWATGVRGLPCVSKVSLRISIQPLPWMAFASSLSCLDEQPGSFGKSVNPSPSLSMPSWQRDFGFISSLSVALEQLKSFKSTAPSLSLSMPSAHCVAAGHLMVVVTVWLWLLAVLLSGVPPVMDAVFVTAVCAQLALVGTEKVRFICFDWPAVMLAIEQTTFPPST